MNKAIVLLSGGMDSSTIAYQARNENNELIAISFDYNQRHKKELESARKIAHTLGIIEHYIMPINLRMWGGSALTDVRIQPRVTGVENDIPDTYVPGRNTIFLAIALSLAEAKGADSIYIGVNALDYGGYPDCRPEYIRMIQELANYSSKIGVEGKAPQIKTPLIYLDKLEIVRRAIALGVPIEDTWSCYMGGDKPCGECDACRLRESALIEVRNGI
jgi:7-cyano-7-deazaguanine synthase